MQDALAREILARAYIQDALAWAEHERLLAQARAHASAESPSGPPRLSVVAQALRGIARRLVPLRADA